MHRHRRYTPPYAPKSLPSYNELHFTEAPSARASATHRGSIGEAFSASDDRRAPNHGQADPSAREACPSPDPIG